MPRNNTKNYVAESLRPFGTSIFTEMTGLCNEVGAVNLSQGFPDFDGPEQVRRAAADAILKGPNQYVHSIGVPNLRRAVANKMNRFYGLTVDPEREITVTAGASEALSSTFLGLLNPGDKVILFEPCYDLYPAMIARAGAEAVYVALQKPDFSIDRKALEAAFESGARAIVINNPLNPTGKVFGLEELELIRDLCVRHDAVAIGDEVYEHLVFDERVHRTLLSIPGLEERAIVISSTAKTFSMTGWKVGYTCACPALTQAVRMSHQFITFCTPGALQEAMALAIGMDDTYYDGLLESYVTKRTKLCRALEDLDLKVAWPEGTYYVTIDISGMGFEDDLAFCHHLAREVGVGAVPESFFWPGRRDGRDLVRFCFCKTDETLDEAVKRLLEWKR